MSSQKTDSAILDDVAGSQVDATCAACPHPRDSHDPIALRFCNATTAGTTNRGCVCTGVNSSTTEKEKR